MAVFRIDKTRDYTVMSNYHLRDRELSCKACGLLPKMLSLPDEWDYITRGLAAICKHGVDAIGSALKEPETRGYLVRHRLRDDKDRIQDVEHVIYETPHPADPDMACPDTENTNMDIPDMENPRLENPAQLNTKKSRTKQSISDPSITHSFFPSAPPAEGIRDGAELREEIKEQIDYQRSQAATLAVAMHLMGADLATICEKSKLKESEVYRALSEYAEREEKKRSKSKARPRCRFATGLLISGGWQSADFPSISYLPHPTHWSCPLSSGQ